MYTQFSPWVSWMRHRSPTLAAGVVLGVCLVGAGMVFAQQSSVQVPEADQIQGAPGRAMDADHAEPQGAPAAPEVQPASLDGTVTDDYGDVVPGATVVLDGPDLNEHRSAVANTSGFFQFGELNPGSYSVSISAKGFENWRSQPITLTAGQFFDVTGIKLKLESSVASVTVHSSTEQIATEQVRLAEEQRILGVIPNFYVVYDSRDAVPLTTKLKFQMAYRVSTDPVTILGAAVLAGMNQAGDTPNYRQGAVGYAERFGSGYADGVTDVFFGGAILPSLLHQDPRYFYQGTGTIKSRLMHAMAAPFICKGDNGKNEVNISSMGGDLISGAISNAYYPASNRGAGLVFEGFLMSTGEREVDTFVQEFVIRKLTPAARNRN
jgi:hypothetical protein